MTPEPVFTLQCMGWDVEVRTQFAQHSAKIPPPGGETIIKYGVEQDLRPVYVIKNGGEEIINYRAKIMDEEKPYRAEWHGLKVALIKKGDAIRMVMEDEI